MELCSDKGIARPFHFAAESIGGSKDDDGDGGIALASGTAVPSDDLLSSADAMLSSQDDAFSNSFAHSLISSMDGGIAGMSEEFQVIDKAEEEEDGGMWGALGCSETSTTLDGSGMDDWLCLLLDHPGMADSKAEAIIPAANAVHPGVVVETREGESGAHSTDSTDPLHTTHLSSSLSPSSSLTSCVPSNLLSPVAGYGSSAMAISTARVASSSPYVLEQGAATLVSDLYLSPPPLPLSPSISTVGSIGLEIDVEAGGGLSASVIRGKEGGEFLIECEGGVCCAQPRSDETGDDRCALDAPAEGARSFSGPVAAASLIWDVVHSMPESAGLDCVGTSSARDTSAGRTHARITPDSSSYRSSSISEAAATNHRTSFGAISAGETPVTLTTFEVTSSIEGGGASHDGGLPLPELRPCAASMSSSPALDVATAAAEGHSNVLQPFSTLVVQLSTTSAPCPPCERVVSAEGAMLHGQIRSGGGEDVRACADVLANGRHLVGTNVVIADGSRTSASAEKSTSTESNGKISVVTADNCMLDAAAARRSNSHDASSQENNRSANRCGSGHGSAGGNSFSSGESGDADSENDGRPAIGDGRRGGEQQPQGPGDGGKQQEQKKREARGSSSSSSSFQGTSQAHGGPGQGGAGVKMMIDRNGGGENSDEGGKSSNSDADKKQARLLRNRESAQMSRQRKKVYVDDLENRLRTMAATIAELNATIAHLTADNVALRRQFGYFYPAPAGAGMVGGASMGGPVGGMCTPTPAQMYGGTMMLPRHHHPGMMPMGVGSMLARGGQAPPIPIPRWPSHRTTAAVTGKKQKGRRAAASADGGGKEGGAGRDKKRRKRTADGAGVAALAIFCFVLVLVPFGGLWESSPSSLPAGGGGVYVTRGEGGGGDMARGKERGRVLVDSGDDRGGRIGGRTLMGLEDGRDWERRGGGGLELGDVGRGKTTVNGTPFDQIVASSSPARPSAAATRIVGEQQHGMLNLNRTVIGYNMETMPASLIVPRDNKLAKIHGNLIIQAVMAGDKAWIDLESGRAAERVAGGELGAALTEGELQQLKAMASVSVKNGGGGVMVTDYLNGKALPASAGEFTGGGHVASEELGSLASGVKAVDDIPRQTPSHQHRSLNHYSPHRHYDHHDWVFGAGGLSAPILTSGVCTELFQFDTSSPAPVIADAVLARAGVDEENEMGEGGRLSAVKLMEGRVAAMAATEAARRAARGTVGAPATTGVGEVESERRIGDAKGNKGSGLYYGRKGGKCAREKRTVPLPTGVQQNGTEETATRNRRGTTNGSISDHEDQCRGAEQGVNRGRVEPLGKGGGNVEVNGSGRRMQDEKEGEKGRSFGYGGRTTEKSLPSAMVVSVLLPSLQPGGGVEEPSPPPGGGGGGGKSGPSSSSGSGKLTQIFVVVLVNSVKYVTYSCLLPSLPTAAAAATATATATAAATAGIL